MEIAYDLLTGLLVGVVLVAFIYFASKAQMKGWLSEAEKFLNNKFDKSKFKENDSKEKK